MPLQYFSVIVFYAIISNEQIFYYIYCIIRVRGCPSALLFCRKSRKNVRFATF